MAQLDLVHEVLAQANEEYEKAIRCQIPSARKVALRRTMDKLDAAKALLKSMN